MIILNQTRLNELTKSYDEQTSKYIIYLEYYPTKMKIYGHANGNCCSKDIQLNGTYAIYCYLDDEEASVTKEYIKMKH